MTRALDLFSEVAPPRWRRALGSIREAVRQGQTLGGALTDCPLAIPPLIIGIVRAGEAGDGIAEAMRRAARHAEASAAASAALRSALAYPVVVAVTGLASVAAMVGIVLPRFALILADIGQELPAMTQLVLGTADIARSALLPALAMAGLAAFLIHGRRRSPAGRQQLHAALLALPVLGDLRHSASTARLATSLGALVGSGVPIPSALRLASHAAGDHEITARVDRAFERIRAGESLANALASARAATPLAVRLIRTGEESGRLASMLDHAGTMERDRVHRAIQAGVRALEPLLILVFAALVGTVAVALLQAVYAVRPL
jgi:general secretion pathway protein F